MPYDMRSGKNKVLKTSIFPNATLYCLSPNIMKNYFAFLLFILQAMLY